MRVAASEARLLALARGLMEGASAQELGLGTGGRKAPGRVGPTADRILRSTLARGAVRALVRSGGWRRERRPDAAGRVVEGRLWERHAPRALTFTDASRRLLVWLTGVGEARGPLALEGSGDALLALMVGGLLVDDSRPGLQVVRAHPLTQLAFAWWLEPVPVDWDTFVRRDAWLIEAVGDRLAAGWVAAERAKAEIRAVEEVRAGAARQHAVLNGFLDACVDAGRRDLADFLLAAAETLAPDPERPPRIGARGLDRRAPLRERMEARVASTALCDALIRLQRGIIADRGVRFIDDGYDAAQARLARWERFGDARFQAFVRERDLLHAPSGAPG